MNAPTESRELVERAKYNKALEKARRVTERPEIAWPVDAMMIIQKAQCDYLKAIHGPPADSGRGKEQ